jgi:hypothetical protein
LPVFGHRVVRLVNHRPGNDEVTDTWCARPGSERSNMGQPVVQFEIIGTDPTRLRGLFGELFGWECDTSGTVAEEVSDPTDYGFIELPIRRHIACGVRSPATGSSGCKSPARARLP